MNSPARRPRAMSSSIPQDTISDIFSRLPIKSLTRFRCLSKRFSNLATDPTFIATHLRRSARNPCLLVRRYQLPDGADFGICIIRNPEEKSRFRIQDLKSPLMKLSACCPKIVGSCNGLVCLDLAPSFCDEFVLWNAGTGHYQRLPDPLISSKSKPFWMVSRGFGYDDAHDDYKIVRIVYFENNSHAPVVRAEVYSWGTGFWKEIEGFERIGLCVISAAQNAVNVKEVLYWWASGLQDASDRQCIVSFNVSTEEVRKIALPTVSRAANVRIMCYKESLAFGLYFGYGTYASRFEFWIRNEADGLMVNWVKVFTTDNLSRNVAPVAVWNDHELLMKQIKGYSSSLWLYNPNTEVAKNLPIDGTESTLEAYAYVDSLVPPVSRRS